MSASATACAERVVEPPQAPERVVIDTHVAPKHERREMPRLIAPPPAYGNKIVMAHAETRSQTN
ncbi:MAG TPA: hypothetical protein VHV51_08830 [Polyangiaceae bacterium]|nr:hypothetical protein [Polyangiaceae bacterium]